MLSVLVHCEIMILVLKYLIRNKAAISALGDVTCVDRKIDSFCSGASGSPVLSYFHVLAFKDIKYGEYILTKFRTEAGSI